MVIKKLWNGVSLQEYNNFKPLTGEINDIPLKFKSNNPSQNFYKNVEDWFETFAIRAENIINAYFYFVFTRFPFDSIKNFDIKEKVIEMIFYTIEYWCFNQIPVELITTAINTLASGQNFESSSDPIIYLTDLLPKIAKSSAKFTRLKSYFRTISSEGINPDDLDLETLYTRYETDELLSFKQDKLDNNLITKNKNVTQAINEIVNDFETKKNHDDDVSNLENKVDTYYQDLLKNKQNLLDDNPQDGNIKKINGLSLLGTGNLTFQGGGGINSITSGAGISIKDTTGNGDFEVDLVLPTINGQNVVGQDNVEVATPDDVKWEKYLITGIKPKNNNYIYANNQKITGVDNPVSNSDAVNKSYLDAAINVLKSQIKVWKPIPGTIVGNDIHNQIFIPYDNLPNISNYRIWISQEITNTIIAACFIFSINKVNLTNNDFVLQIFTTRSGSTGTINNNQVVCYLSGNNVVFETRTANNNTTFNVLFNIGLGNWIEMEQEL